jgi:SagB-type dehydrogenase family enzyme
MPITDASAGEFLRCSMGLSAWKQYQRSRWALRVNPSSGNLHPTEAYVVRDGRVCHYAPKEHALEERAVLEPSLSMAAGGFFVALTSIHWREAWKYGERAFRYCQHDTGHAIGALRFAAALLGWTLTLLPQWSDDQIAALLGLDRDADFAGAEDEEPECIAVVTAGDPSALVDSDPATLVDAARRTTWTGVANQLSSRRVAWPIIDEVAVATRRVRFAEPVPHSQRSDAVGAGSGNADPATAARPISARGVILQRRSAVAFDATSTLPRATFVSMLARTQPHAPPWDAIHWPPHIHLLLFVHRVEGLAPGVYAYPRDPAIVAEWRAAMRPEFLWEDVGDGLFLLLPTDVTWVANRVSCDQDIAADGFFSLGMIARLESSLRTHGSSFYRRLFWETGLLGQVLYLEAEAAGARSTGIGCFYDDAVHETAGLSGHEWQSLYHFSMGVPVDDDRLTTEPGYAWERASGSGER